MSRLFYSLMLVLALPYLVLHLLWRGWRQRGYWRHWGERFGFYTRRSARPVIWLHAVSVGETRAAVPLVQSLLARYPGHQILLTHTTPTGRETSEQLFGDKVWRVYLPYDYAFAVRRFVRQFRPVLGMLMETEIWPNLIAICRCEGVPVMLVNARLSERSARRYRRLAGLVRYSLTGLTAIAAQTPADAVRLQALGGQQIKVMGNLKFDSVPPVAQLQLGQQWRSAIGEQRPVWLAASTREGEEALVLDAWQRLHAAAALLIIVPRHPQRFDEVAALLEKRDIRYQRRSSGQPVDASTQVWLGDSMGELFAYYRAADVALVGGSLLPLGGQNLIEAAAVGCPVIIGQHVWNFAEVSRAALASGAALQVNSPEALALAVGRLLNDGVRREQMRQAALAFARSHQGATERLLTLVASHLAA
nr:lipid IV(A) 3-deoxy-D-manno-octulosonic acid transferase [Sulfuriferula sp. AH1]